MTEVQPGPEPSQAPHDHDLEELEADSTVPPRPEEEIADAQRQSPPSK